MAGNLSQDGCGALVVNRYVAVVGLRLHWIGLLIDSRRCRYGPVVEWLSLEKYGKVWCDMVYLPGADTAFCDILFALSSTSCLLPSHV